MTWKCCKKNCAGRIKTSNNVLINCGDHSPQFCIPDPTSMLVHKAKNDIKIKAANSPGLTPVQITNEVFGPLPEGILQANFMFNNN